MKVERHYYNPTPEQRHELKVRAEVIRQAIARRRKLRDKPLKIVAITADISRFLEDVDRAAAPGRFASEPPSGFTLLQRVQE